MQARYSLRLFLLALPVLAAMSGCTSTSLEDAVPGARNTGTYPNLNIPPQAETEQLTDEEAAERLAALQSRRDAQKSQSSSTRTQTDRLLRLKRTHADETLEEIEN